MNAVVCEKQDMTLTFSKLNIPKPKQGEVLVKINSAGVCHTDLHLMNGYFKFPTPFVPGHEVTGEIVEVNETSNPQRLKVGMKVACSYIMPCGDCTYCNKGDDNLCLNFLNYNRTQGLLYAIILKITINLFIFQFFIQIPYDGTSRLSYINGQTVYQYLLAGLAEYNVMPQWAVYEIPEGVDYDDGAIIGCAIQTAYGAVKNRGQVQIGDDVAILGVGGIGVNVIQLCSNVAGANKIIAIDVSDDKLENSKKYGATHTINTSKEDAVEKLLEITKGKGVDVVFEAVGLPKTFSLASQLVKDGGKAVMLGIAPAGVTGEVEITRLVRRKIQIIGSLGAKTRTDMPDILNLCAKGKIDFPVSKTYKFDQAIQAYHDLENGKILGRAIIKM